MTQPLFPECAFGGFGPTALLPESALPDFRTVQASSTARLKSLLRLECPRIPGVYGMLDGDGHLIYVGKAKRLRVRLMSYFQKRGDRKGRRILSRTRAIVWERLPSEFAALLRELELIRRWRPRYNVMGLPGRRQRTYVCLGRSPAPYAYLSRQPRGKVLACFGPVAAGKITRNAVRFLNDFYQLRDCPNSQLLTLEGQPTFFATQPSAGCLRLDLGNCLGPCVGHCTRTAYAQHVTAARNFLNGKDLKPLTDLAIAMREAAAALAFERAAFLRDQHDALEFLARQLQRLREVRASHSFLYPVAGHDGGGLWYLIHGGQVRHVFAAPSTAAARADLQRQARRTFAERPGDAVDVDALDTVLLVAAWFRKRPGEWNKVLTTA